MTYAQPLADPTAVMGRRIGAYFIDALLGLVILAILLIPLASSIADKRTFATSGEAADFCQQINDGTFGTSETGTDTNSFAGNDRFCVPLGTTTYSVTADDMNSFSGRMYGMGFLASGVNLLLLQGLTGASVGKYLTGLRVIRADGTTVGIGWNALRWLLLIVDGFCCALVGLITAFSSKGHRRVGDMAAGTFVVRKNSVGTPIDIAGVTTPAYPPYQPYQQAQPYQTYQQGQPAPNPEGPTWDAARSAYIQYDREQAAWVQWDDATQAWRPIDQ